MYRVFLITNLTNNKHFVSVQKRTLDDMKTNLRRKSNQVKQWNDSLFVGELKSHGIEKFNCILLDESTSKDEAIKVRDAYIKEYKSDTDGYNQRRLPGKRKVPDGATFILALTNRRTGDVTVVLADNPTEYRQLMISSLNDKTDFAEFSKRSIYMSQRLIGCEVITYLTNKAEAKDYYNHLMKFLASNKSLVRVTEARLKRILRAEIQNLKDHMSLNRQEEKSYV